MTMPSTELAWDPGDVWPGRQALRVSGGGGRTLETGQARTLLLSQTRAWVRVVALASRLPCVLVAELLGNPCRGYWKPSILDEAHVLDCSVVGTE